MTFTTGHLFAGIDGFGLGLAQAGPFETRWTVEFADFPHGILSLREPNADHLRDVRDVTNPPPVDVLTGGFPCQDLSLAGRGAGIGGSRSGLWTEYARIIGEVRPKVVLIENVPALLSRGMELVVENLVDLGYSVEWDCIPAAAAGAPHLRDRVWVVAHHAPVPIVFGEPAGLLPLTPRPGASGWCKWPRAGFTTTAGECMELVPMARITDVRKGAVRLLPTPQAADGDRMSEQGIRYYVNGTDNPTLLGAARRLEGTADEALVPTPTAHDAKGTAASQQRRRSPGLAARAESGLWPTPASMDATSGHTGRADTKGRHSLALHHLANNGALDDADDDADAVAINDAKLWPTVVASDALGSRRATAKTAGWASNDGTTTLLDAVSEVEGIEWERPDDPVEEAVDAPPTLWPTPRASGGHDSGGGESGTYRRTPSQRAGKHGLYLQSEAIEAELEAGRMTEGDVDDLKGKRATGGALNPDWVEWLMGFPLGWTNPDTANDALVWASWADGEPAGIPRVLADVPKRRERLTALGNALVPPIPAWLGARILDHLTTT